MSISNNGGEDSNVDPHSVDPHSVDPRSYEPESYAFSGKIMLSAIIVLFIVVLLIVCLHIYARWYLTRVRRRHHLRRRRRRTHLVFTMDLSPTAASAFSRGLDASVLKTLPTFIYQSKSEEDSSIECAVCLSEFDEGEKGRLLPKCNHSFHTECIDMWFKSHSTCPLCRSPVEAVKETAATVQIVVDSAATAESTTTTSEHRTGSEVAKAQKAASSSHSSENSSSSVGSRRKAFEFGVSIEVPRRNESFKNFLEEHAQESARSPFKSPGGRMLSFKRMLSRDRRHSQPSTPTPMTPMSSTVQEIDLEIGECEEQPVSQQVRRDTPRPRSNNIGEEQRRTTSD